MRCRGAYGLRITGFDDGGEHLMEVPSEWPQLEVRCSRGVAEQPQPAGTVRVWENHADIWLAGGDRMDVLRDPPTLHLISREPFAHKAIVHPYLGLPATIVSRWLGRIAFHGGAFVHGSRGWGLLGGREAGKSATLGALMRAGLPVLTDDVLIVEGTTVFAGPRSVDLRADAAERLGGERLGIVGNRTRWRLRPAPSPPQIELGGLIELVWGDANRIEPLDPQERLQAVIASTYPPPTREEAVALLEIAALPAWRYTRRLEIDELERQIAQLLEELSP
jgi:hypothetical protein